MRGSHLFPFDSHGLGESHKIAVINGTCRLRYLAGDDVTHFVDARQRLGDEGCENYMR
jgi:hypothetical protein